MRLDPKVNSVLNDIMSSDATAVLLFAPDCYNKADFITELSSRYYKHYWFTAKIDDMQCLGATLAERVLTSAPELLLRIRQLLFCSSCSNGDKTVISAVLDYIASVKREVIFVFEDMELLPKDFDYNGFLYMVNHAPSNLKILLSASDFLPVGLYGFEPKYPMLVDETTLTKLEDDCSYIDYISDLTDSDIAFLCYYAGMSIASERIISKLYPAGARVLKYLSRMGIYVSERSRDCDDDKFYQIDKGFGDYLKDIRPEYEDKMGDYKNVDINEYVLNSICDISGNYFEYLLYALKSQKPAHAESAVEHILHSTEYLSKLPDFLRAHAELLSLNQSEYPDYPYINVFKCLLSAIRNEDREDILPVIKNLKAVFNEEDDMKTYFILTAAECAVYDTLGDIERVKRLIAEVNEYAKSNEEYKYLAFVIEMLIPNFTRYTDKSASDIEAILTCPEVNDKIWYFKALESLETLYFAGGSYRKSFEIAGKLKSMLPSYVIPPRIIATSYYDTTDINVFESKVDEAIKFACENDLKEDIHMLYTAKSLIFAYRGNTAKSKEYSDLAFENLSKRDSYEKFFTITERVWQRAKAGEQKYAYSLANAYFNYARAKATDYVSLMAAALGYVLYKTGKSDEAYNLAQKVIERGENRTVAGLMCMGIVANCHLSKGETQEAERCITEILETARNHGLIMLLVDNANDIFTHVLSYAQQNQIAPKTTEEIMRAVRLKDGDKETTANVMIKMFGDVSIMVGGKEIQWKTRKARDLFLLYILAGKVGIERSVLLDLLWKDYLYESAINNLKTTNNIIRKTLDAYGVGYKLNYINSRYSISVENLDNEYERYKLLLESYNKEPDILSKAELMDAILRIYRADLAVDVNYPDFEHERTSVKQELVISMIKLIRALAKQGEYLESKRFLNMLTLIDGNNDYNHMIYEIDRFINLTK